MTARAASDRDSSAADGPDHETRRKSVPPQGQFLGEPIGRIRPSGQIRTANTEPQSSQTAVPREIAVESVIGH
ncbi:hypothetical protein [Haloterrigena salinisoli]|uniref:hypothetical protein n=1 Tax=Haloterrigena salinisoli TaxID=3132747 RepID=UPI0030CD9A63